jgi:lipopolysaccharide heptosyltransferase II
VSWADARRLLCVRLDALGDMLMTTPALKALRAGRADRRLTVLTSSAGAAAARLVPEVDEVIVYDAPWMKATAPRSDSAADHAMAARLRQERFAGAVIFTVYSQNPLPAAMLCHLADIPLRLAHCRENPYQLLTDWVSEPEPDRLLRHEVRRQLDLVASIGCRTDDERLSLQVPPAAAVSVRRLLRGLGLGNRGWVVIHPGGTAPSRRYPAAGFADVAVRLAAATGCTLVFTGTHAEAALIDDVRRPLRTPSHSLAGRLELDQLAALIARAPLLISNNTGPVHIAAATGTPVVDLYALTNPQHTPWGVAHRVLSYDVPCKNCYKSVCPEGHHHCLTRVEPQDVVTAALALLDGADDRVEADAGYNGRGGPSHADSPVVRTARARARAPRARGDVGRRVPGTLSRGAA